MQATGCSRVWAACLWILFVGGFAAGAFVHELWSPDEVRVSQIANELGETRSWWVPTLGGKPFLEKPPLVFGLVRAAFWVGGGPSAGLARLPSMLFALGTGLVVWLLARRSFGSPAAWVAAACTVYSVQWLSIGHRVVTDPGLAFAVAGAVWCLHLGLYPAGDREAAHGWMGFYGFCVLAFWCKGLLGITFPVLAFVGTVVIERRWREPFRLRHLLGGLFILTNFAAWAGALWWDDPSGELVKTFLIDNHLNRVLPGKEYLGGHVHSSPFYYLARGIPLALPSILFSVHAGLYHWRERTPRARLLPVLAWLVLGFVLLSLAGTKRNLYLLPLQAPLAIAVAPWLSAVLRGEERRHGARCLVFGALGVLAVATLGSAVARWFVEPAADPVIQGVLVAVALGALGWILPRVRRWDVGVPWAAATVLFLAYPVGALPWYATQDEDNNMRPFAERVQQAIPEGRRLVLFHPDENVTALIPYYTDLEPPTVILRQELEAYLGKPDPAFIIAVHSSRHPEEFHDPHRQADLDSMLPRISEEPEWEFGKSHRARTLIHFVSGRRHVVLMVEVPRDD